jgi:hypothetical protein
MKMSAILKICTIFFTLCNASVTVIPLGNPEPKLYHANHKFVSSPEEFFAQSASSAFMDERQNPLPPQEIYASSFQTSSHKSGNMSNGLLPSVNSFVHGMIDAWGQHSHLIIRPDDVWFEILVQMNLYMSNDKNAEDLRHLFVEHKGQKKLQLVTEILIDIFPFFEREIQNNVKTPWLTEWITPTFTTSNSDDKTISIILMMGLMRKYFHYSVAVITCGFPSVTLLGEKKDWEMLEKKLDRLAEFGNEPKKFQERLKPIFRKFVSTFSDPASPEIREFWNHAVHAKFMPGGVCGVPSRLKFSGWLTGFFYWDDKGQHPKEEVGMYALDGVQYPITLVESLPNGYAKVPMYLDDSGRGIKDNVTIAAGLLGKKISNTVPVGYMEALRKINASPKELDKAAKLNIHSTLQPNSAWGIIAPQRRAESLEQYLGFSETGPFWEYGRCSNDWERQIKGNPALPTGLGNYY